MRYIGIIILLVLCLTLLLLTSYTVNTDIPETAIENIENQENTEDPEKWSGLGMNILPAYNTSEFDGYVDELLANGFTEIRFSLNYFNTGDDETWNNRCKAAAIRAISKGADIIFGVTAGGENTITASNWEDLKTGIENAATWAQANGIHEFQIGNEEELHNDDDTMTDAELIVALKSVATDVKAIFTRGKVSYSCWEQSIDDWITAGKGDIDILASNVYIGGEGYYGSNDWKIHITNLINAFGADGTYITEFGPSYSSLEDYSTDEAVQAAAVTEMIDYMKAAGIKRALFYIWKGDEFGVVKDDGTYRLLWSQALLNTGSVKSTIVSTTTTTISLPGTIVLIPK